MPIEAKFHVKPPWDGGMKVNTICLCPRWPPCPYMVKPFFSGGERGGSVVECRTPEREVRGSRPTAAVLCPWARHFTPRKYWLITQEAMAPSRHDWKIVDWDVKPQHNQPTFFSGTKRPMTLKLFIQHRVLKHNQSCSNYDTGLSLTMFMTWTNLFPNASAWVKAHTAYSHGFPSLFLVSISSALRWAIQDQRSSSSFLFSSL